MTAAPATRRFDYFVVFADMRTGSNFLEANLNEMPGIACLGELFHPVVVGHKDQATVFDMSLAQREADPLLLLRRIRDRTQGLAGFRFFNDHDPRILDHCLTDERCAKVILTRNPLESYLSLKIALQTRQWALKDMKHQRTAKVPFDAADFETFMQQVQAFQMKLLHGLQVSGQAAFYIAYEDIGDLAVLNGLARFLGVSAALEATSKSFKKQNPEETTEKVFNPAEMEAALARLDRFNLNRTPNFEPRRGGMLPGFQAAARAALLYQPIRATGEARLSAWLAALDGAALTDLQDRFSQKTFRHWKRQTPGHLCFTMIRHPVARAHTAFCDCILSNSLPDARAMLKRSYKVPLPEPDRMQTYDLAQHHAAFLAFLGVMKGNLAGQTSLRIDPAWATQSAVIQGFSQVQAPDLVLREDRIQQGLAFVAAHVGRPCPDLGPDAAAHPFALADIYDAQIEAAAQDAYQRDYLGFGFGSWQPMA